MAENILITCPDCQKQLKGPAELLGKKIRCKTCGYIFTVKAAPAANASADRQPAKAAPAAKAKASGPAKGKASELAPQKNPPPAKPAEEEESKTLYKFHDIVLGHRCPQCAAELEDEDSIICLNCGYNTQTRSRTVTVMTIENTMMEWILWLAPGVLCAFAVLVAIGVICFLWIYFSHRDEKGELRQLIFAMQVWGSVFTAFLGWYAGRFAVKRLIRNYHPPEKALTPSRH
jgi:rubredoxin